MDGNLLKYEGLDPILWRRFDYFIGLIFYGGGTKQVAAGL